MMRAVITMTDPLNRLLHDAAGQRPDPEPSRRAIRATLGQGIARRRRRDARARVARTAAITAALVMMLCGQLGSDDFEITVETKQKAGRDIRAFSQGQRGEEIWIDNRWTDGGLNDKHVEELFQQRAADRGVTVGLLGWQVGPNRHFLYQVEYILDGRFISESAPAPGESAKIPAWFKLYMGADYASVFAKIDDTSRSRDPDLTVPMSFGDLQWIVKGWRIGLPGKEELIYYRGERADGVRSKDPNGM
jgi:hypothetical protein